MKRSFSGNIEQKESKVWNMHIDVPDDVYQDFKSAGISRLICTFNQKEQSHCAFMPHGNGLYFIMINKELRKKMGLEIGSEVHLSLEEDKSKYGMPMPEELEELLRQDPLADKYFHDLTPGKQRNLLFIVGKPKGSDIRLKKAITICEYLKSVNGKLDFKELNQAIKDSRFKL